MLFASAFSGMAKPVSSDLVVRAVNTLIAQNGQMGCPVEGPVSSVRLCTATNGASFYVAKLAGGGFVVTSTDTEIDPIIAISSAPDLVEDNPLWSLLVRDMAARQEPQAAGSQTRTRLMASAASGKSTDSTSAATARWARLTSSGGRRLMGNGFSTISDVRVAPLLKTKWGQSYVGGRPCYNYYTPGNYVCGCEATAIAQVFRCHRFPTAAVESQTYDVYIDGQEFKLTQIGGYYDWDNMPDVPAYGITEEQRRAIGKLTYDISVGLESSYTRDLTDARLDRFVEFFKEWGYVGAKRCDLSDLWGWESDDYYSYGSYYNGWTLGYYYDDEYEDQLKSVLVSNLDAKLPVVICMYGWSRSGKYIGHVIVADGYGYLGGEQLCVHLNLGWNGDQDAWYVLPGVVGGETYKYVGDSYLWYNIYPHGPKYGGIASGRVLSASARTPISGIAVMASNQVGKVLRATTDAKGIYAFILPSVNDSEYWPDGGDPDDKDWPDDEGWVISLAGASPGIYKEEIWNGKNYYGLDFSLQEPFQLRTVALNANGGSVSPTAWSAPSGYAVGVLPEPTRTGYEFEGWFTAANGGTKVTESTLLTGDVTYHAHWRKILSGTLTMTAEEVRSGGVIKVTVSRVGGSERRIAVKLKTQDSATVGGINGVSGRDFQYVKEYLVWEDGDASDRVVYIQTCLTDATDPMTFRLKLSVQTTGDYADCVPPTLADGGKKIVPVLPAAKGTIAFVEPDPMEVVAGYNLRVKVRRTGGSVGRVAVKLKTQDSSTVNGIDGVVGRDFQYVKEYLVWGDGDESDRTVEIPTYAAWWSGDPKTFRLKLSVQTAGDYKGCMTPALASGGKVIASIYPNEEAYPGAVGVTKVETVNCCAIRMDGPVVEPPWWGYAGDTLRVTVSRVGGSFGRVAVKAKTQGYPGVSNLSAVLNEDLTYVKEYLEWKDGETGDQVIEIPTAHVDGVPYPRTFRLKFTAQTTGDYVDCATPELPNSKVIFSLY